MFGLKNRNGGNENNGGWWQLLKLSFTTMAFNGQMKVLFSFSPNHLYLQ
jgi:hypothetical protein